MIRRIYRIGRPGVALAALALALAAAPASAQQPMPADSVRAELERLRALVDSLRAEVDSLHAAGEEEEAEDALAELRAAAQAAADAAAPQEETEDEDREFVGRQRSLQALNPEISVNADVFAHVNQDDVDEDNFFAREFEISIISNLDPFSRAKVFLSRHFEGGEFSPFEEGHDEHGHAEEGGGFNVEEGYVEWVGLPAGLGLKLGKFFQQFGQLNRWHAHALPFQTRSLPHLAFIGEESLAQTGASVHWLAPVGGDAGTYEATLEVTTSSNERLFGESGRVSVLGNVNAFWQLSRSTDLDLSLSWLNGSYEDEESFLDRDLYGAEMAFTWRPPGRARYQGLQLRGGVMALDGLVAHDDHEEEGGEPVGEEGHDEELPDRALGLWSLGELRLSQSWLVGARFDWAENPEHPEDTAWLLSPTLTWWQSEYVRVRAEYDLIGRSFTDDREGRFLLQVTFAMGPHKHSTY